MTEIAFEDIRKGDYIEVVWERNDRTDTSRGTAHRKAADGWWRTRGGQLLAGPVFTENRTIYRHPRPAPTEPEGLGAIVWAVVGGNGWYFHRIGTGERPWINVARNWHAWSDFDPDSIEVLYEGKE